MAGTPPHAFCACNASSKCILHDVRDVVDDLLDDDLVMSYPYLNDPIATTPHDDLAAEPNASSLVLSSQANADNSFRDEYEPTHDALGITAQPSTERQSSHTANRSIGSPVFRQDSQRPPSPDVIPSTPPPIPLSEICIPPTPSSSASPIAGTLSPAAASARPPAVTANPPGATANPSAVTANPLAVSPRPDEVTADASNASILPRIGMQSSSGLSLDFGSPRFPQTPHEDSAGMQVLDDVDTVAHNIPRAVVAEQAPIPAPFSREAQKLTGKHIPENAKRSSLSALNLFSLFFVERNKSLAAEDLRDINDSEATTERKRHITSKAVKQTRSLLFCDNQNVLLPAGFNSWSDSQLQRVNNALIEFIAHYRVQRTGEELAPGRLNSYVAGIQRAFESEWGYDLNFFSGHVFKNKRHGVFSAFDNKVRERQAAGAVRKSHNTISTDHIVKLYNSELLSNNTPRGFITRIILNLILMTSFRKTELWSLRMSDVNLNTSNGAKAWRIVGRIGSRDGSSETQSGGLAWVNAKPKEVLVFDMDLFDGALNMFKDIEEYLSIVRHFRKDHDHFLAAVNYNAAERHCFFKKGNLGVNTISKYLMDASVKRGIQGEGVYNHVTVHSFRATVASQLYAAGFDDASVALRTGHRDFRSLKAYHNLRGDVGRQQQVAIFGQSVSGRPSTSRSIDEITAANSEKNSTGHSKMVVEVSETGK